MILWKGMWNSHKAGEHPVKKYVKWTNLWNTPYAERKETGSNKCENEASWALFALMFARVRNMAAHGSVSNRLSQSLTEEDIPGASLQGRNPTALKTDELCFWLKCRGDPAKGLKIKRNAQLAER